jgi:triacylglycerol esterase/lipase EstA (alpha/beta hydrolase family)/Flp pilus assembly protein TadD
MFERSEDMRENGYAAPAGAEGEKERAPLRRRTVTRGECRVHAAGEPPASLVAARRREPVLYVPGFFRFYVLSAAIRRRLRNLDFEIYTLRLPNFGAGDIRRGARILLDKMEELRILLGAKKVSIIGQGVGGLVARFAVERMGGADHLKKLIMLGTPNGGSYTFYLFLPFKAARQTLPGSAFLGEMNARDGGGSRADDLPYVSICTPWDLAVVPWTNCCLPGAENLRLGWLCTHMGMVRSRSVVGLLVGLLGEEGGTANDILKAEEDRALLQELNRVLAENPGDDGALLRRARLFMDWGYYRAAIKDLDRLVKVRQDLPEAYMLRGKALRRKIQYDDNPIYNRAIRDFNQVIRMNPGSAEAYYERGVCYALLNAGGVAVDDWDRALILNPDYYPAYLSRGLGRKKRGNIAGALEDFREVLRINPDEPDALRLLSGLGG